LGEGTKNSSQRHREERGNTEIELLFCEGKKEDSHRERGEICPYVILFAMGDLITEKVIGAAIEVHRQLGPGLLESTYERCFAKELDLRKIRYERQKICNLLYKGLLLEEGFRIDLLVENEVILEIKSVNEIAEIHDAQLLTYLRLLNLRRGLILNFNVPVLKAGIKRFSI
jgi:GxxExxY protein